MAFVSFEEALPLLRDGKMARCCHLHQHWEWVAAVWFSEIPKGTTGPRSWRLVNETGQLVRIIQPQFLFSEWEVLGDADVTFIVGVRSRLELLHLAKREAE